jgi:hypothetical protein
MNLQDADLDRLHNHRVYSVRLSSKTRLEEKEFEIELDDEEEPVAQVNNDQPDHADRDEETMVQFVGNLLEHVERNGKFVAGKFEGYRSCPELHLFFADPENKKRPLHASRVWVHKFIVPQLYRQGTSDSLVDLENPSAMHDFFMQFKSVIPYDKFEANFHHICELFESEFKRHPTIPSRLVAGKEAEFRERFISLLKAILAIVGDSKYCLNLRLERLAGAAGVLCAVLPGTPPTEDGGIPRIDPNAGILSFADLVVNFGHEEYGNKPFFVAEFKGDVEGDLTPDSPWVRNGGAMSAQMFTGAIGHKAPLTMGILPIGYKAVVVKPSTNGRRNQLRFGWFPGDAGLHGYEPGVRTNLFCYLAMQIARIGAVEREPVQFRAMTVTEVLTAELNPPTSPPAGPRSLKAPDSTKKSREDFRDEGDKKPRRRAGQAEDEVLTFVGADGSLAEFVKLDVEGRLSPEEIDEQYKIHLRNKQLHRMAGEADD